MASGASGTTHDDRFEAREELHKAQGQSDTPKDDLLDRGQQALSRAAESAAIELARERYPRRRIQRRGWAMFAVYCIVLAAAVALSLAAHTMSVLPGDLPFTRELQETTVPGVAGVLTAVSYIGYPLQSGVILAFVVVLLLIFRMPIEALFVLLTLLADALGGILKVVVGRQRPSSSLVHVVQHLGTYSFPSGHVLHYTVFYGFLFFVVAASFRPSWRRTALLILLGLPIALVGLSRVYLGEHWASDVVGGYLIGALCLVPLIWGYLHTRERLAITSRPPFVRRRHHT